MAITQVIDYYYKQNCEDKTCQGNSFYTRWMTANIKRIKTILIKMKHYKISKLLNDSTVFKFVTKNWREVNNSSSGQYFTKKNIRFNPIKPGLF